MSADIQRTQLGSELSFSEKLERMETMTDPQAQPLLDAIKARLSELEALLEKVSSHWPGAHLPGRTAELLELQRPVDVVTESALRNPWFHREAEKTRTFDPESFRG